MEEFTIFYSFQTDSHEKTNFHFIRDVLKDACKSIKQFKVNLDVGFNASSGTRELTNHMLRQSSKADIFIGDVTYTSEFNDKIQKKYIKALGYNIKLTATQGRIKKYPNGNVLLETGYSWAKKDYARTLLIMNTAYGNPNDTSLPADMMHLEYPVPYHLSEEQLQDEVYFKKTKSEFTSTLKNKILDMINFERKYLREAFDPISHHEDWPNPKNHIPYRFTEYLKKRASEYRATLEIPGQNKILVGSSKSGKTRFAYELFRKNRPEFSRHDCVLKTYFYDFSFGSFDKIHGSLLAMKRKKQHFVIILDNCTKKDIDNVEAILTGSLISVMFIQEG
jgi:hypothetical protein